MKLKWLINFMINESGTIFKSFFFLSAFVKTLIHYDKKRSVFVIILYYVIGAKNVLNTRILYMKDDELK